MNFKLRYLAVFFSAFLLLSIHAESAYAENKILILSDIHFSPFAGCHNNSQICPVVDKLNKASADQWPQILAQYSPNSLPDNGQVTNYALIQSMLAQLKLQRPDTVLILGDFLAHLYYRQYVLYSHDRNREDYNQFVEKTMEFLINSIQQAIPRNSLIYPVIGNNDSYGGPECKHNDYCSIPNGIFFTDVAKLWKPLPIVINGGYYETVLPKTKDHIIALNTVLFSPKALGPDLNKVAQQQLSWLSQQLQSIAAHNEKAWIIFHIPPGIDSFATAKSLFQTIVPFWKNEYSKTFNELVNQYNLTITAVFSGHTHTEGTWVLSDTQPGDKVIDQSIPSISPIFGNNPAYKIYSYDKKNFKLLQSTTYLLNLNSPSRESNWQRQ